MKINYYRVTNTATIESVEQETFRTTRHDHDQMYLVTILESESSATERFLTELGVSETAIYSALNPRNVSVVFPFEQEVYFEFPVCIYDKENNPREQYVCFLCLKNLVICLNAANIMTQERLLAVSKQLRLAKSPCLLF
jgi:hypothetical protein